MRNLMIVSLLIILLPVNIFAWERSYSDADNKAALNSTTSLELIGWRTNLDGNVDVEGLKFDLDTDARFANENRLGFLISHSLSEKSMLQFTYMKVDFSGAINKTVTFNRRNYKAGASTRLQNSWYDFTYAHNLVRADSERRDGKNLEAFYLDGLFGLKFSSAQISLSGRENTFASAYLENSWSEEYPVPYIGVAGGGQFSKNVWIKGFLKYVSINAGGNAALHHDYGINIALKLNQNSRNIEWFVDIGYRGVKYDFNNGSDKAELLYNGPTLGAFARF